jgi:hypothetical protein
MKYEDPVRCPGHREDETDETHPAYAQVQASRVQGKQCLYGTDFVHHSFMRIRVCRSWLLRGLSRDWYHSTLQPLIEFDLSEAQWATFISTPNSGTGTPCTLQYVNGQEVPQIPEPPKRKEQFQVELGDTLQTAAAALKDLKLLIDELKIPAKTKQAIFSRINAAQMNVDVNLKFVVNQFGEHIDTLTEHAKIEAAAYLQGVIQRAGLEQLGGQPSQPMIESADHEGDEKTRQADKG